MNVHLNKLIPRHCVSELEKLAKLRCPIQMLALKLYSCNRRTRNWEKAHPKRGKLSLPAGMTAIAVVPFNQGYMFQPHSLDRVALVMC